MAGIWLWYVCSYQYYVWNSTLVGFSYLRYKLLRSVFTSARIAAELCEGIERNVFDEPYGIIDI